MTAAGLATFAKVRALYDRAATPGEKAAAMTRMQTLARKPGMTVDEAVSKLDAPPPAPKMGPQPDDRRRYPEIAGMRGRPVHSGRSLGRRVGGSPSPGAIPRRPLYSIEIGLAALLNVAERMNPDSPDLAGYLGTIRRRGIEATESGNLNALPWLRRRLLESAAVARRAERAKILDRAWSGLSGNAEP